RADMRMATVDSVAARLAGPTGTMVVTRRSQQVIAKMRIVSRRIRKNKRCMIGIRLVPVMTPLNDVRRATAAPIAATMGHEQLPTLVIIQAPLVAASMREYLELVPNRMIAPHSGTQFN